jgi:hypothetical protein
MAALLRPSTRFWLRSVLCASIGAWVAIAATAAAGAGDDPGDALIQGEYVGSLERDGELELHAIQVIARGKGKFDAVLYRGGFPGWGWDRGAKVQFRGKTEAESTKLTRTDGSPSPILSVMASGLAGEKPEAGKATADLLAIGAQGKIIGRFERVSRKSPTLGARPPEGALVLFDGASAERFRTAKGQAATVTADRLLRVEPGSGGLFITTPHESCRLHVEFRLPFEPEHEGQGRANSGCYLQGRYEVQILDSFGLEGKENECGGVYSSGKDPDQNLCFPPLAWQTYDIDFTAATYGAGGKKTSNAKLTVRHNGVLVYDSIQIDHATTAAPKPEGPEPQPLYLQDHGHEVHFRNLWMVSVKK